MDTATQRIEAAMATVEKNITAVMLAIWEADGVPEGMEKFVAEWIDLNEARMAIRGAAEDVRAGH